MAKDYKSLQRLNEGDVISAEVFNDIMDRLELTLKPIQVNEILGKWRAKQYLCDGGGFGFGEYCDTRGTFDLLLPTENEIWKTRTDEVTIEDSGAGFFTFTSKKYHLLYSDKYYDNQNMWEGVTLTCNISPAQIMGCKTPFNSSPAMINVFYNIKRTSPTQIVLFYGPTQSNHYFNHVILDKIDIAPEPPQNLKAINSNGTVSLTWDSPSFESILTTEGTIPIGKPLSFKLQAKDSSNGIYSDLGTTNTNSFEDTINLGVSRWYRVFAVNENGTSKGSNVVSISYSE